ncbi:carboxymuconolactone decarboxylase family protein [Actinospica acidiphila]|uniref:carboxymuconolactone decarboxylase family protein n=1 Tax=Streptomyces TaxID=1883 RepID=UPI000E0A1526|nr:MULTISPECIES: carboxymuconolactone decarboxylase family protein [unclassified Streptomyces]AXI89973.1 carboxymuconolactone decarboxylase [Streptomyces sp. ETH9427]MBU5948266.1 carboxymuconolactone decarboxylase family protein [Streptomyces sp. PAM3C]NEA77625.1 carboxymuconolactone decarboxylase family protein [Actinospica acidiphila]
MNSGSTVAITTTTYRDQHVFIDKSDPEVFRALTRTAQAAGAAATRAGLPAGLVELVNIRVSQINGCAYCLRVHTRTALEAGETAQRLGLLPAWRETEVFTPAERAALALAEATTNLQDSARGSAAAAARADLTDEQISAVLWVAISINAFNRVSIMSGHPVKEA